MIASAEAAGKAGIAYVDVWDGFVDENNRYSLHGPDVEGQTRRLRAYDGVHFTSYGARKLAHYVEREVTPALFFNRPNVQGLIEHFAAEFPAHFEARYRADDIPQAVLLNRRLAAEQGGEGVRFLRLFDKAAVQIDQEGALVGLNGALAGRHAEHGIKAAEKQEQETEDQHILHPDDEAPDGFEENHKRAPAG